MEALAVIAALGALLWIGVLPLLAAILALSARSEMKRLRFRVT